MGTLLQEKYIRFTGHFSRHALMSVMLLFFFCLCNAQDKKQRISLRDSGDHALDLSDYIINANGFIPVPYLVTEPALGGFGGALAPVFIKKRPAYMDSVNGSWRRVPVAPDITGGAAMYTANKTWVVGAFRSGTFIKSRIKYAIGAAYANVNMSFYKTFDRLGEKELKFNIKAVPVFLQATKKIGHSRWYAGAKYFFLSTNIHYAGDTALSLDAGPLELSSVISQVGLLTEYDSRDNIFTPDNGMKLHLDAIWSDNLFGSDYDYCRMNYYMYAYKRLPGNITAGFRLDGQQVFGDGAPFYILPYIDMRGVPASRYQGNGDILSELEMRYDVVKRWSLLLYCGAGKAFDQWSDFGSSDWVWSYGTGFRYLLARKFKLRVGVDIAHGPDTWAYYIVFGSSWLK